MLNVCRLKDKERKKQEEAEQNATHLGERSPKKNQREEKVHINRKK